MAARRLSLTLESAFTLAAGQEEVACVDLADEWPEDAVISRHPGYTHPAILLVSGQVGEGGDHANITFKNVSEESVTIGGAEVVVAIQEAGVGEVEVEAVVATEEVATEEVVQGSEEAEAEKVGSDLTPHKINLAASTPEAASENGTETKNSEKSDEDVETEKVDSSSGAEPRPADAEEEESMETEETVEKPAPVEPSAEVEKTGLTPDKIDLAACSTPAKKSDPKAAENASDASKEGTEAAKKTVAGPTMTMRFVDETVGQAMESSMDVSAEAESTDEAGEAGDAFDSMLQGEKEKPAGGLKLASFSTMTTVPPPGEPGAQATTTREAEGCAKCLAPINSPFEALAWETMQFCNESCLGAFQGGLTACSSCRLEVAAASMGKYCVRFGSDIKQFCSNPCLEDYKKGLKVCSYCQKDISGGEGFLAPIGDKGQFKDFCDAGCLAKHQQQLGKVVEPEVAACGVCGEERPVERELLRTGELPLVKLCGAACLSAFQFSASLDTLRCDLCTKHFDTRLERVSIHYGGGATQFCSKACQNVYVMQQRRIVACSYCKVKKYNFDMVERFPGGTRPTGGDPGSGGQLFCSLTCLGLHGQHQEAGGVPGSLPVISAVSSLAPAAGPQVQMQTQTVREVVRETHVLPPEPVVMRNKAVQSQPYMLTKGVSCRPHPCHKETQTEGLTRPTPIPIPVPIYVPTPCKMYNAPFPVPLPVPLPFPVPIFIPTTRRSMKGIQKIIKKILNKIPADPFEAELLALAGDVAAGGGRDSSDSESDPGDDREDWEREVALPQPEAGDLENEMAGERILPKPLPVSTPDPQDRQRAMGVYNQSMKRERPDGTGEVNPDDPEGWTKDARAWAGQMQQQRGRRSNRGRPRGSSQGQSPAVKRFRQDQSITSREQQAAIQAIQQQPKERPDANHHLKFTYGVNAWKHWVVGKNAELEKQREQGKYQKTFETDILKLRADELNFTLCMFVKEVKKPNGDQYAADSILYLVLGIQEFLFENGRIDNLFGDTYYDPFTSGLHEVVKDFKLPVNELGYFVTRIEEEHLWEAKQLGAHSPQVLLNTLVYFNTKYFQLKTVDQHLKLSFSHIMKHWKKTNMAVVKPGQQQRTVLLRYYPPPAKGQKPEDRKMYEQHENHENPLRCPVKLYEFYLSKCPESTKNRNDMFYLQPERSCVPDSPVWYSAQLLNRFHMEKMLDRLLMVREVQEHMLADQAS